MPASLEPHTGLLPASEMCVCACVSCSSWDSGNRSHSGIISNCADEEKPIWSLGEHTNIEQLNSCFTKCLASDIISCRPSADWKKGVEGRKKGRRGTWRVGSFILWWRLHPACCFGCSFFSRFGKRVNYSSLAGLLGSLESDVTVMNIKISECLAHVSCSLWCCWLLFYESNGFHMLEIELQIWTVHSTGSWFCDLTLSSSFFFL